MIFDILDALARYLLMVSAIAFVSTLVLAGLSLRVNPAASRVPWIVRGLSLMFAFVVSVLTAWYSTVYAGKAEGVLGQALRSVEFLEWQRTARWVCATSALVLALVALKWRPRWWVALGSVVAIAALGSADFRH